MDLRYKRSAVQLHYVLHGKGYYASFELLYYCITLQHKGLETIQTGHDFASTVRLCYCTTALLHDRGGGKQITELRCGDNVNLVKKRF